MSPLTPPDTFYTPEVCLTNAGGGGGHMRPQRLLKSQPQPVLRSTQRLCWAVAFRVWVSTSVACDLQSCCGEG